MRILCGIFAMWLQFHRNPVIQKEVSIKCSARYYTLAIYHLYGRMDAAFNRASVENSRGEHHFHLYLCFQRFMKTLNIFWRTSVQFLCCCYAEENQPFSLSFSEDAKAMQC